MVKRKTLIVSILGIVLLTIVAALQALVAAAETPPDAGAVSSVNLGSIRDNTLYEESDSLSNGKGEYFFAGATQIGDLRRGLVKFDIAKNLPPNAFIVSATLRMYVSKHPIVHQPESFAVHRVLSDWGEGTSDAPFEEGTGTAATQGDATWAFSFYSPTPTERIAWTNPGGDFLPAASASTMIDVQGKSYTWGSTPGMLADLRLWLRSPDENHGWLVMGNESNDQTARRFNSRENSVVSTRPVLTVEYVAIQGSRYLPLIVGK